MRLSKRGNYPAIGGDVSSIRSVENCRFATELKPVLPSVFAEIHRFRSLLAVVATIAILLTGCTFHEGRSLTIQDHATQIAGASEAAIPVVSNSQSPLQTATRHTPFRVPNSMAIPSLANVLTESDAIVHKIDLSFYDSEGEYFAFIGDGADPSTRFRQTSHRMRRGFVAIHRRNFDGSWAPEFERKWLNSNPTVVVDVELIKMPDDAVRIAINGMTGNHTGTFDLIRFDGALNTEISTWSASPSAGTIFDFDGNGIPEIAIDTSNPYVFCYACGVEESSLSIYRWKDAGWSEIPLARPPGLAESVGVNVDRAIALAKGDLWRLSAAAIQEAANSLPGNENLNWLATLLQENSRIRLAHAGSPNQPLLTNVIAGEYAAALDLMRKYDPAVLVDPHGPLIKGTAAESDPNRMAAIILDYTDRALEHHPAQAPIHALRAIGLSLTGPDSQDRARGSAASAFRLAPADPLVQQIAEYFDVANRNAERPPSRDSGDANPIGPLQPKSTVSNAESPQSNNLDKTKFVYLTFDDGPHPEWTPILLDLLEFFDARATFFVTGNRIETYPKHIRRIVMEGHAIGNHSFDHLDLTELSPDEIRFQIASASKAIAVVAGSQISAVTCFRPPYGATNQIMADIAREYGMEIQMWTVDTRDWEMDKSAELIAKEILDSLAPGAIILMHDGLDGSWRTIAALAIVFKHSKVDGFEFAPLPGC